MKRFSLLGLAAGALAVVAAGPDSLEGQSRASLREVADIGCASCSDWRLLSNVLSVTVRGREVYVLDATPPKVRVFDLNGRRVRAMVQEGRADGQALVPAAVIVEDSVFHLFDIGTGRVATVGFRGDFRQSAELPTNPIDVAFHPPARHAFVATVDFASTPLSVSVWRITLGSWVAESVWTSSDFPRDRTGAPSSFFAFAMTPTGGFVIGEGAYAYRIRVFDESGTLEREIERDVPRTRMTDRERQQALERRRVAMGRIGSLARLEGGNPGRMEQLPVEENYFSAEALRYDDAGRLWVKTDRGNERLTIFDVFSARGEFVGEFSASGALGVYDIDGESLAGLGFGTLDFPLMRVYRIPRR